MKLMKLYLTIGLFILLFSCSKTGHDDKQDNQDDFVSISAAPSADTKLVIDPTDMKSVSWEQDDLIYIWANIDGGSEFTLTEQPFFIRELLHENKLGVFSSVLSTPMAIGKYTYYSTFPKPSSTDGLNVTHKISQIQDGAYSDTKDIMATMPLVSSELAPAQSIYKKLHFKHLTHLLKIEISADRNLFKDPIQSLVIKFPENVVGDYVVDLADPFAPVNLLNAYSNVRIDFPTPIMSQTVVWVYIAPTTIKGEIHFGAIGDGTGGTNLISVNIDKTFEAGKVTPIKLTIPPKTEPKKINLKVAVNNLGEDITKVTATAPGDALFSNGKNVQAFELGTDGYLSIQYYDELFLDEFKKGDIKLVYESKSVLLSGYSINLNNLTPDEKNNYFKEDLVFPYLLEQDFSEVLDKNNSENVNASWLTDFGLSGWSGAKWTTSNRTSLSVHSKTERPQATWIIYADHGNVVTPPFAKLKDGVKVQLDVSFNYSGSLGGGASAMSFNLGSTTNASAEGINTEIPNRAHVVNVTPINGSPVNINLQGRYAIENVTNNTRLMWVPKVEDPPYHFTKRRIYTGALYIDNLKVSIKQ